MARLKLTPGTKVISLVRDDPEDELVVCFVSGRTVPKRDAVQVRIGPRQRVWMLPEYCNSEDGRAETG